MADFLSKIQCFIQNNNSNHNFSETKHSAVYYRKGGGKGESLNEEAEASYIEVL